MTLGLPWNRRRRQRELDEELRAHFRMAVDERVSRGESYHAATYAVRREFGNVGVVKEVKGHRVILVSGNHSGKSGNRKVGIGSYPMSRFIAFREPQR